MINCLVEGNNIFKLEYGTKECIGVTSSAYKELEASFEEAIIKAEEYKNKLIEHGLIEVPKTPEQVQKEILEGLGKLTTFVSALDKRLEALENEPSKNNASSKTIQHKSNENNGSSGKGKTISE